jgi:hypothetical protein
MNSALSPGASKSINAQGPYLLKPFEKPPGTSGCKSLHAWNRQLGLLAFEKELISERGLLVGSRSFRDEGDNAGLQDPEVRGAYSMG